MNKSKVVINKAFYLGDLKKDSLFLRAMGLIYNDSVVYGLDSCGKCYYKQDNKIEIQDIDIEKDYMKVSANFSQPEFIDTSFKEINLKKSILMYVQEQEIWIEPVYHIDLFMLPFQVRVLETDILVYPIIKTYENNSIIISYSIYIGDRMDTENFKKIFADFNRNLFEKMTMPVYYAPKHKEEDEVVVLVDDENCKYIEVGTQNYEFRNIISFSWYLLNYIYKLDQPVTFYGRCSYFIESSERDQINKQFIDTLLKGVNGNYKYELKNDSLNRDYKKFFNERASIVVGKDAENIESEIQAIEERMMLQVINLGRIVENLKNDKYSYNELKKIYNKTVYDYIEHRDSHYGEVEYTLQKMHAFMKSKEKIEFLKMGLEEKIKEKDSYYQEKTALFALLLSAGPICDYMLFPMINDILHMEKIYNFIKMVKGIQIGFLIREVYLKGICFIIAIGLIYFLYKVFIRKK